MNTPQLGQVCITNSDAVRYRTLTRKRLLQFDEARQKEMLRELYEENLIETMPESFRRAPWIEVEARHKERAIGKLRAGWLATRDAA